MWCSKWKSLLIDCIFPVLLHNLVWIHVHMHRSSKASHLFNIWPTLCHGCPNPFWLPLLSRAISFESDLHHHNLTIANLAASMDIGILPDQINIYKNECLVFSSWWRHQMETFSALLALCAGNSPVTGEFPTQRPVTRSFDVFFDLRVNKRLSKQSWGWWFKTPVSSLWRHCNANLSNKLPLPIQWRPMSAMPSQFTSSWISVRNIVHTDNKENIKVPHHWPFVWRIHQSPVFFLTKEQ